MWKLRASFPSFPGELIGRCFCPPPPFCTVYPALLQYYGCSARRIQRLRMCCDCCWVFHLYVYLFAFRHLLGFATRGLLPAVRLVQLHCHHHYAPLSLRLRRHYQRGQCVRLFALANEKLVQHVLAVLGLLRLLRGHHRPVHLLGRLGSALPPLISPFHRFIVQLVPTSLNLSSLRTPPFTLFPLVPLCFWHCANSSHCFRVHGPVVLHLLHRRGCFRLLRLCKFTPLKMSFHSDFLGLLALQCQKALYGKKGTTNRRLHCFGLRALQFTTFSTVQSSPLYPRGKQSSVGGKEWQRKGRKVPGNFEFPLKEMIVEICPTTLFFNINTVYNGLSSLPRPFRFIPSLSPQFIFI